MPKDIRVTTCTVQRSNGAFCDAPSHEDAPFPICGRHAIKLWRHMNAKLAEAPSKGSRGTRPAEDGVVYYLQVGELIKIGTSTNLQSRLKDYPPDHIVLALERGGTGLESYRLKQFSHLLAAKREWFTPGAELLQHINDLRSQVNRKPIGA